MPTADQALSLLPLSLGYAMGTSSADMLAF
jgi:hypothetical protein